MVQIGILLIHILDVKEIKDLGNLLDDNQLVKDFTDFNVRMLENLFKKGLVVIICWIEVLQAGETKIELVLVSVKKVGI